MSLEDTLRNIVREELRAALDSLSTAKWEGCLRLTDAAKLVSVSVSTLEKWGRQGLPLLRKGHVRMVDVAELRAFVAKRETTPPSVASERVQEILATVMPLKARR